MNLPKRTPKISARSRAKLDPQQILVDQIVDLVGMIARLKELSLEEEDILRVVRATTGVGSSVMHLAGLLKALGQFEEQVNLADAFYEAVQQNFGSLPAFLKLGESGLEDNDPLRPLAAPSGRQPQEGNLTTDPGGEPSAAPEPEPTGARPAGQAAAGRKTNTKKSRRKTGSGESGQGANGGPQQAHFDF